MAGRIEHLKPVPPGWVLVAEDESGTPDDASVRNLAGWGRSQEYTEWRAVVFEFGKLRYADDVYGFRQKYELRHRTG